MKINEKLKQMINTLDNNKIHIINLLLECIEDGAAQTIIEDRIRNEIREIIIEVGDQT